MSVRECEERYLCARVCVVRACANHQQDRSGSSGAEDEVWGRHHALGRKTGRQGPWLTVNASAAIEVHSSGVGCSTCVGASSVRKCGINGGKADQGTLSSWGQGQMRRVRA